MTFRMKLIISMLIVFIIAFDISVVIFVSKGQAMVLKAQENTAADEFASIYRSIDELVQETYMQSGKRDIEFCSGIVNMYKTLYNEGSTKIDIESGSYSGNNIYMTKALSMPYEDIVISYEKDISDFYNMKREWKKLFVIVNFVFDGVLFVLVYSITSYLTKPLYAITRALSEFREGNFKSRIDINTKDEFQPIADEFNSMAETIGKNIDEINKNAEEKEMLVRNMAHELRNPLAGIQGFSEYLMNCDANEEDRHKALCYINSEAQRLSALSNKILNMGMIENNESSFEKVETTDIGKDILKHADVILNYKIDKIFCDKILVTDLLINIVDNAVKAEADKIEITFDKTEEYYSISVRDNGVGMEEKELIEIFKPFYRVNKDRSREKGGAGLGLSYCESIAKAHGGYIKAYSEKGKGSEFIIFLQLFNK